MKNTKISLTSKYLKIGDKIIRTNGPYSTDPLELVERNSTHIKVKNNLCTFILSIKDWNNGTWVRYNLS